MRISAWWSLLALATTTLWLVPSPATAQNTRCGGGGGYWFTNDRLRNPQPGGWVADGASVDESSEIARTAQVCGSAVVRHSKVLGNSVISGDAIVEGSTLQGNVKIGGDAIVRNSTLRGFYEAFTGEIKDVISGAAYSISETRQRLADVQRQISGTRAALARHDADVTRGRAKMAGYDTSTKTFEQAAWVKKYCLDPWRKVEGYDHLFPPQTWEMGCPEVKWVLKIDGKYHIDHREISKVYSAMRPYESYWSDLEELQKAERAQASAKSSLSAQEAEATRLNRMLQ
jgi:hypothetical protein